MIMNGQNMTTIISDWAPRSSFPLHSHPHEQMGLCLQGEAVFTIDGEEYVVGKGEVYTIPPNVQHMQLWSVLPRSVRIWCVGDLNRN
ncbi:MAG: cupin domain-containing protein [Deltaproteobacteria bacterium]|nr:cupin domain-containing protein [Deltaproteobacteria bacterium]